MKKIVTILFASLMYFAAIGTAPAATITSYAMLSNPTNDAIFFVYDPNMALGMRDRVVSIGVLKSVLGMSGYVPLTRTINSLPLSSDISLTAANVGAASSTTTVNGYPLSSNVSLGASDVGLGNLSNVAQLPLSYLDIDHNMTSNSETKVPSQASVVSYVASHSPTPTWGGITGTLSFQTDLQTVLNAKVPTSRTINGHALSANFSLNTTDIGIPNVTNTAQMPLSYLDTDVSMVANSDTKVPSQAAVVSYVLSHLTNPVWGYITGVLSQQTDLQAALDAKLSTTNLPSSSSQYQMVLFGDTTGKVLTGATGTGFVKVTSGVATTTTDGSTLTTLNASNLSSGTVASARGGAGTVTGLMYANGAGTVSAATAAQVNSAIGYTPLNSTAFSGTAKITVGTVQPTSPNTGDLWVDTTGL